MLYKVGDIVKSNEIYRIKGPALCKIVLDEPVIYEIVKATKTSTYNASYVVKNVKTGEVEKYQYWESDLYRS